MGDVKKDDREADRKKRFEAWLDRMSDDRACFEFGDDLYKPYAIVVPSPASPEKTKSIPVMFKLLAQSELAQARRDAIKWMADKKLDRDKERDIFQVIDTVAVIALAVREPNAPYGQYRSLDNFLATFKSSKLHLAICDAYKAFEAECDPRPDDLPKDVFRLMIEKIRKAGHLGPLVAIDGPAQDNFVLRLVDEIPEPSPTP